MNQFGFLDSVKNYDKEKLNEDYIKKLAPHLAEEMYDPDKLVSVNKVAANFARWVLAMDKFYRVNLIVIPKKA